MHRGCATHRQCRCHRNPCGHGYPLELTSKRITAPLPLEEGLERPRGPAEAPSHDLCPYLLALTAYLKVLIYSCYMALAIGPKQQQGGDLESDEAKTRRRRRREQVQAKNKTGTTPSNQTRRQAGGFQEVLATTFHPGSPDSVLVSVHAVHEFNRGTMDLQRWMTRFQLTRNRFIDSWMDLLPGLEITNPEVVAHIAQRCAAHDEQQQNVAGITAATPGAAPHVNVPWTEEMSMSALVQLNTARRTQQRRDNLSALLVVSLADLTQDERNTLTSIRTHRGRTLAQYNVQERRDLFLEMFCTTKTEK